MLQSSVCGSTAIPAVSEVQCSMVVSTTRSSVEHSEKLRSHHPLKSASMFQVHQSVSMVARQLLSLLETPTGCSTLVLHQSTYQRLLSNKRRYNLVELYLPPAETHVSTVIYEMETRHSHSISTVPLYRYQLLN